MENSYLEEKLEAVVDGLVSSHCSAALKKSNVVPKRVHKKKGLLLSTVIPAPALPKSNTCQDSLSSMK